MKVKRLLKLAGFSLIEIILVLVIISMILLMAQGYFQQQTQQARIDKTVLQMQQVLNAGLTFYVQNGSWPPPTLADLQQANGSIACLQGLPLGSSVCGIAYLPTNLRNPFDNPYQMSWYSASNCQSNYTGGTCPIFYVWTKINAGIDTYAVTTAIAGKLPLSYTANSTAVGNAYIPPATGLPCAPGSDSSTSGCYIVAAINAPGQNLSNASAVNFAGLYHHGACVPVPICPQNMEPQIMVVPVSVSGTLTPPITTGGTPNVYPISSFTAFAEGGPGSGLTPNNCPIQPNPPASGSQCINNVGASATDYWRVCLQITTENGDVASTYSSQSGSSTSPWGQYVTVMAVTRCAVANEPAGSNYTSVYSN